jgi:hypothetical protein
MLIGYLSLSIKGTEVLISETEADVYRDLLKKRIMHKIGMFN